MLLASRDPKRLGDWYVEALGPDKVNEVDQYRILQFGSFTVLIDERSDVADTNPDPTRVILNFHVDDAAAVARRLDGMGVEWIAELEERDGSFFATAKDPDGNYVQVIQLSAEARAAM